MRVSTTSTAIAALLVGARCVVASPAEPTLLKRQITLSLPIIGGITIGNNQGSAPGVLTSTYYSTITTTTTSTSYSGSYTPNVVSASSQSSSPIPTSSYPSSSSTHESKSSTHKHTSSDASSSGTPSVVVVTQTVQVIVTASAPLLTSSSLNTTNMTSTTSSSSSTFLLVSNTPIANNGYQSMSSSSTSATAQATPDIRQGDSSSNGPSSRTTAGIAVGSILGGLGALGALVFVAFRYKRRHIPSEENDTWYPAPSSPEMEQHNEYTYASPSAQSSLGRRLSATLGLKSNAAPPPTSDIEANPAAAAWWAAATASSSPQPAPRIKSPFDDDNASIGRKSDETVRPRTPTALFGFGRRTSQHGSPSMQNNQRPNSPGGDWDPFRSALDNYHVGR